MGPWDAVGEAIGGWFKAKKLGQFFEHLNDWLKLIFSMGFSYAITFSFVCGTALVGGAGWPVAIGSGMISGAAMALVAFLRAKKELTQGVTLAVPQGVAEAQFDGQGRGPMVSSPPEKK